MEGPEAGRKMNKDAFCPRIAVVFSYDLLKPWREAYQEALFDTVFHQMRQNIKESMNADS